MTDRSIRRAQERKARKELRRKTSNAALHSGKAAAVASSAIFEPQEAFQELDSLDDCKRTSISPAQLTANRANAQLSTGPRSSAGKAKASLNAVKSGLTGRTVLLVGDDAAEYERHLHAFEEEYAPLGQRESDLVQSIADTWWRLQRIPCLENALFAQGYVEFSDAFEEHDPSLRLGLIQAQAFLKYEKQIRNLNLQESRLFRRYEKDRAELRELQQHRREKESEALEAAAIQHSPAKTDAPPLRPVPSGFEFSTEEIEQCVSPADPANAPPTSYDSARHAANAQAQAA